MESDDEILAQTEYDVICTWISHPGDDTPQDRYRFIGAELETELPRILANLRKGDILIMAVQVAN